MKLDFTNLREEIASGQDISIIGVKLGADMQKIPINVLTSADPNVEYHRSYHDNKIFRIHADKTETEVTIQECYEEVRAHGGWLRSDGVAWHINNQHVNNFFVREPYLEQLQIGSEEEIVRLFGEPEHKKMGSMGVEYYYPSKKIEVVWSRKKSILEVLGFGDFTVPESEKGEFYVGGFRKVSISYIEQSRTYEGLLEGVPNAELNDRIIDRIKENVIERFSNDENVHLIKPVRTEPNVKLDYPFDKEEILPDIICVAKFHSDDPATDEESDGSSLVVVWFQDELAMPVDENIISNIEAIAWEELARDCYF